MTVRASAQTEHANFGYGPADDPVPSWLQLAGLGRDPNRVTPVARARRRLTRKTRLSEDQRALPKLTMRRRRRELGPVSAAGSVRPALSEGSRARRAAERAATRPARTHAHESGAQRVTAPAT